MIAALSSLTYNPGRRTHLFLPDSFWNGILEFAIHPLSCEACWAATDETVHVDMTDVFVTLQHEDISVDMIVYSIRTQQAIQMSLRC